MRLLRIVFALALVVALFFTEDVARGEWYGGATLNSVWDGRGLWARIYSPSSIGTQYNGGHSAWVAAITGIWLQTGWLIETNATNPWKFWEYCIDNGSGACPGTLYLLQRVEQAPWGSSDDFEVAYNFSNGQWCAYFGSPMVLRRCVSFSINTNVELQARNESHDYANPVNSLFDSLKYQDASGVWHGLVNHRFAYQNPYFTQVYNPEKFRVVRAPNLLFLPSTIKN